jgi:steroid 5-alpha reductase family enzyme
VFSAPLYLQGLIAAATLAALAWPLGVYLRNVAIVDSLWSLMVLLQALVFAIGAAGASLHGVSARGILVLALVTVWALRLSGYITWRNWGLGEDRRYQAIRARNEPYFAFKSLYLVFLLQAVLAWIIAMPLLGAILGQGPLALPDYCGVAIWVVGFLFEAGGDWQLARFKANPGNRGKVMDQGLWAYTRHPNYFGDCCQWWGLYLIAMSAGAWWSIPGPLVMSVLLIRVSGVRLLEKDISNRHLKYPDYIRRTNAFFPGMPRK